MTPDAIEFADPSAGVSVTLTEPGASVVTLGDEVLAALPTPAGGLNGLDEGRIALTLENGDLGADLSVQGDPIRLEGDLIGSGQHRLARVRGGLRVGGHMTEFECFGVRHETRIPAVPVARRRSIAIATAEGDMICIAAALPDGAHEHDDEQVLATMSRQGELVEFGEALLSTEYDRDGHHRRATLELWPTQPGDPPVRGAGTSVNGASIEIDEDRLDSSLFRWSIDGTPGLGRYEIITTGKA